MRKYFSKLVLKADRVLTAFGRWSEVWVPRLAFTVLLAMVGVVCWFDEQMRWMGLTILLAGCLLIAVVAAVVGVWELVVKWAEEITRD